MTTTTSAEPVLPEAEDGVITTRRLRAAGLSAGYVARRCRPGGPWRRLCPGVVLLGTEATRRQRLRGEVAWLGPDVAITGVDALNAQGLQLPVPPLTHLLVPTNRRVVPTEPIVLERTQRMPDAVVLDGLPHAPVARATIDAARRESSLQRLVQLLSAPVCYGLCTVDELKAELDAGTCRGAAAVRRALHAIGLPDRAFLLGSARRVLGATPLPRPRWQVRLCDLRGTPIDFVDAWWEEPGLAWQILPPTPARRDGGLAHLGLTAAGVTVVRTSLQRLREEPTAVARDLAGAFRDAALRPRPKVTGEGTAGVLAA